MKRFLMLMIAICSLVVTKASDDGILFEISGNGLKKPSYILGSYHVMRGEFVHGIPSFEEIYKKVSQVCFETDMDKSPDSSAGGESASDTPKMNANLSPAQILLPVDSGYTSILGKEKAHLVDSVMKSIFPMFVENMRPAYAKLLASTAYTMKLLDINAQNLNQPFEGIDYYVYGLAKKDNKKVQRLEPISVQESILKSMASKHDSVQPKQTLEDEMNSLYDYCKGYGQMVQTATQVRQAYSQGHGEKAISLLDANAGLAKTDDKKVKTRNASWMKVIPGLMKKNSTLFVVGLAHLFPYKDSVGILNELKKMGYNIKAVK